MSTSKCRLQWNKPEAYDLINADFQWELAFKATTVLWEVWGSWAGRGRPLQRGVPGEVQLTKGSGA